jgi:hypothetical protein
MTRTYRAWAALALLALSLNAGCTNQVTAPPNGMTTTEADDIAVQTVASLGVVSGDVQFAIGTTPPALASARQVKPASAQWETTFVANGIQYTASRTFYDASDNLLPGYGPTAVRLHWTSHASGTYQGPRDTATVTHDAVLDVRGIESGNNIVTFDGGSQDTLQNVFRSLDGLRTRYFLWVSSCNVAAVKVAKASTNGWPISGTITFTVSADRLRTNNRADVEAHFDATVVATFNGTNQVAVVVSGAYTYHWNLLTNTISRA